MKKQIRFLVLATILLTGCCTTAVGCASHVTGATPKATTALKADAVVIRVNELQATVIEACGQGATCQPNSLSTPLARDIVQTCISLRTTLRSAPDGWQATVRTVWAQARPRFSSVTNPAILAALSAVDAFLGGV